MKMLTKEIEKRLPPLYANEGLEPVNCPKCYNKETHQWEGCDYCNGTGIVKDPIVYVKFFTPWTNWTWYGLEYDPEQRLFFGYVEGMENELGYFSLDELESIKGPFGLKIERDMYFDPCPLSKIKH